MRRERRARLLLCAAIFLPSACGEAPSDGGFCGDGVARGIESCDLEDLRGGTCQVIAPGTAGELGCTAVCEFDTSGCMPIPVCGNGQQEGDEECDGDDLADMTCTRLLPGSVGTLTCGEGCQFDDSCCLPSCGDAILDEGEECDCGDGSVHLPQVCTDYNGGAAANCSVACEKLPMCGDAIVDAGEECDDGNLWDCDACDMHCDIGKCWPGNWDPCQPADPDPCCADEYGVQLQCVNIYGDGRYWCVRPCTHTGDCYWSNSCHPGLGNTCFPDECGPFGPVEELNVPCLIDGLYPGWCFPNVEWVLGGPLPNGTMFAKCIESGTLAHGEPCQVYSLDTTDRSEQTCSLGLCFAPLGSADARCVQFCVWEEAYEVAIYGAPQETEQIPCPPGSNCFSEAHLDPTTGKFSGSRSFCRDLDDVVTCSLVTSQLMSDPTLTCADVFPDGRCEIARPVPGFVADMTLVGVCMPSDPPQMGVWDQCDPGSSIQGCPHGSICEREDLFSAAPSGSFRCIPYCDTGHCVPYCDTGFPYGVTSSCQELGAGATAQCISLSHKVPGALNHGRLGLCALPVD